MRKIILVALVAIVGATAACEQTVTDYRIHHFVTRIKADTVVDQRNAWCEWANNPKPALGSDVGDQSCGWTNPTPTVHP